jgi:hypothetical protein
MQKAMERPQAITGIALMAVGVACLCINDAIAKTLTAGYLPVQILFVRNLIALPIAALIAWRMGGVAALRSHKPAAHLLRGAIWLGAATLFFTGLSLSRARRGDGADLRRAGLHHRAVGAGAEGDCRLAALDGGADRFRRRLIVVRPGSSTPSRRLRCFRWRPRSSMPR